MDRNPKGYEVAEHIVKVRGKSMDTFNIEKRKVYLTHEPRGNFNTSGVRPLGNLFSLVKIQIGKGYSKSGRFSRRPSINPFLTINFSLVIEI